MKRVSAFSVVIWMIFMILAGCTVFKIASIMREQVAPVRTLISMDVKNWDEVVGFVANCTSPFPVTIAAEETEVRMHCEFIEHFNNGYST